MAQRLTICGELIMHMRDVRDVHAHSYACS